MVATATTPDSNNEADNAQLSYLWSASVKEMQSASPNITKLNQTVTAFESVFQLPFVSREQKEVLVSTLVGHLKSSPPPNELLLPLSCLCRVVSRVSADIELLAEEEIMKTAGAHCNYSLPKDNDGQIDPKVRFELQKMLCNLMSQYLPAHQTFKKLGLFDGLMDRLKTHKTLCEHFVLKRHQVLKWSKMYTSIAEHCTPDDILLHNSIVYDLRLFFILTAKTAEFRLVALEFGSHAHLLAHMELCLQRPETDDRKLILCKEDMHMLEELNKCLYNVLIATKWVHSKILTQEESSLCASVCLCSRRVLSMTVPSSVQPQHWMVLVAQAVNQLTTMPEQVLSSLTDTTVDISDRRPVMFHNRNMAALLTIIELLEYRIKNHCAEREYLVPILCVLISLAKIDHVHRKYLRFKLLPPLRKEVLRRPEEGDSNRNALVRLMTDVSSASQASSELIFILCKRNVGRLIKYTGYGNAAGLLANHGLLAGDQSMAVTDTSDDSDTEEYEQLRHKVNPVTGFVQEPVPNAMEGMTDEQKEYEAMKLVEHLDKLMNQGVIKPASVGADGKPQVLEHVLQLCKDTHNEDEQEEDD